MQKFELRTSVGSASFLPKTQFVLDADHQSLVLATSWGLPTLAGEVCELISREMNQPPGTSEETVLRGANMTVTPEQKIHSAFEKAQKFILKKNEAEYKEGLEVMALFKIGHQIYFAQVGGPQIFSLNAQGDIQLISVPPSMSALSAELPPLPTFLLGIEKKLDLFVGQFPADLVKSLVFSSQALIPKKLLTNKNLDLQKIVDVLTHHDARVPFWVGLLELS